MFYDPEPVFSRTLLRIWNLFIGLRLDVVEKSLDLQRAAFRRAGVDHEDDVEIALALDLIQVFEGAISERRKAEAEKKTVGTEG